MSTPLRERPALGSTRPVGPRRSGGLLRYLGPGDVEVLRIYVLVLAAAWLVAYCAGWIFGADPRSVTPGSPLDAWVQWDVVHYQHVAQQGYAGATDQRAAFFPGLPLLLRLVHVVVPSWTVAGLLVSAVSGAVVVVALRRLADASGLPVRPGQSRGAGARAVTFLLVSPCAVFLVAGYTEMLFLACALPAWLAARRGRWALAAVLATGAASVRPTGLFLAVALGVEMVTRPGVRARLRTLGWLGLPLVPVVLFVVALHGATGDWLAWQHAEEQGWNRGLYNPLSAWSTTWSSAFGGEQATGYAVMFQAELVAMVVGVLLVGWLLRSRRWGEAVYVGLSLAALGTSYWYVSIPRATLLWWPLWTGLATWSLRRRVVAEAYLFLVAPLSVVVAVTYLTGRWAG